ncbi:hypothetical protein O181_041243 [Austropuccinia psidii MF-1]|uniref:Uncharacterized protein n=1 Tax=Austropuccinia psidii MF-1 TaxID=1389203 RepID=A0A9Q3DH07_9BASI|nr:hypothetical protein [Austropuccinia psidii MF-1]
MHLFQSEIQWHQYQMFISGVQQFIKACHLEDSSRFKRKVSISSNNDAIKPSLVNSHSQYSSKGILEVHSKAIFKRKFQNNFSSVSAPSIHLGNHIHSIQSGFIKICISFLHHGNFTQPSSFPDLARCTLPQYVNTASRIQYRPAVSLKDSSSQLFTYTSLL